MSLDSHMDGLRAKHRDLETAIEKEQQRPMSNELLIAELKKKKLSLKDEMRRNGYA